MSDVIASEQCNSCRFWQVGGAPSGGFCRRNAPTVTENQQFTGWPWTLPCNWCGEYQPIAVAQKAGKA